MITTNGLSLTETTIADDYLDYFNNWLSYAGWASAKGISEESATEYLSTGRKLHEKRVEYFRKNS